jgi:hypothetical protein
MSHNGINGHVQNEAERRIGFGQTSTEVFTEARKLQNAGDDKAYYLRTVATFMKATEEGRK